MEMKPESEPLDDPFGWRMHDKHSSDHSGQYGHYCMDFDGLWICRDCSDFACCTCLTDADKAYFDAPSIPISEEEREAFTSRGGWPCSYLSYEPLLAELIVQIRQLNETIREQNKKTND